MLPDTTITGSQLYQLPEFRALCDVLGIKVTDDTQNIEILAPANYVARVIECNMVGYIECIDDREITLPPTTKG